jgi:GntR family transcriptional regulator
MVRPVAIGLAWSNLSGVSIDSAVEEQQRSSPVTAYRVLHDWITGGRWSAGARLPSERALAEELGVGRTVLRRAIGGLVEAGLLEPAEPRGWAVVGQHLSEGPNVLRSFSESAQERGLVPGSRILGQTVRPASYDEAELLGLAPAAQVVEVRRLRTLDGVPVAVHTVTVPARMAPGLESVDLTDASLYQVLEERFGLVLARCDYTLQAEAASASVAPLLDVPVGAPVLVGHEITVNREERPLSHGRVVYRGDAYRFRASLFRV